METPQSRKRMMAIATLVCIGLCVAIYVVTPPPPAPPALVGCGAGGPACAPPDPFCYQTLQVPDGVCTRPCDASTPCPAGGCCVDHLGQGDPRYFVCAPADACAHPDVARARVGSAEDR